MNEIIFIIWVGPTRSWVGLWGRLASNSITNVTGMCKCGSVGARADHDLMDSQ